LDLSGFLGIAIAIASFAIAETASSYGFLSAFFTGLFAQYHKHKEMKNHSKTEMLLYTEENEKFLIVVWVMIFGGFLANGILRYSSSDGIIAAFLIIMVLRPLSGMLGMFKTNFDIRKKWAISFFGIKGLGSFFYLAFALYEGQFELQNELYAIVSWVVLFSIIIHGTTSPRAISYFEQNNLG